MPPSPATRQRDVSQEVSVDHPGDRHAMLRAEACPLLSLHRIQHAGWQEARAPYRRVRLRPTGSYVLVSLEGQGNILLDGRWRACRPGTACLAPPRVLNAFYAEPGQRWRFCWVRYHEPPGLPPLVNAASPVRVACTPGVLHSAILGLLAEAGGAGEARFLHHWIELIHGETQRLAVPWRVHERLAGMWAQVAAAVARPWDAATLARLAHCSTEHLRRLCLRELGRTPMQQVTYMRMQRAGELLQATGSKLEAVAEAVGYGSAFALSKTFKRWFACSPAEYRRQAEG